MAVSGAAKRLFLSYVALFIASVSCSSDNVWGVTSPLSGGLDPVQHDALKDALYAAHQNSHAVAARTTPLPMKYSMFQGESAIRSIPSSEKHLLDPQMLFGVTTSKDAHYRACAILLLLRGYMDAAHEVILGVTLDNLDEAEYAATHRGQTNWTQEHPLSDSADVIHAAIHRFEGSAIGEGNYTGFENSKYWLAGGPKTLNSPAKHAVRTELARIAREHAPCCLAAGVVAGENGAKHTIIADGGKTRTVCVPKGEWDGFVFVDLCERHECGEVTKELANEVTILQRAELVLMLRFALKECNSN